MLTKHLFVLIHIRNKGEVSAVKHGKAVLLLWIIIVICVSFRTVMLSCLFLAALWSPAGKGLTSWLSCM